MNLSTNVFDQLSALADATRSRLLLVLERQELAVSELCAVLQLPQSTVSRHLKLLGDEGWVVSHADGTSRRYRMASKLDDGARALWKAVRAQAAAAVDAEQDAARVRSVLAERGATADRSRSREFFSRAAGSWEALRTELFGERPDLAALPALLDASWTVGDLGCGTGQLSASLAPFVRRVIAVDESEAMLAAARARLSALDAAGAVELRAGALEDLPIADGELDAAVLSLVLEYLPDPAVALAEAGRALRSGGRLLVLDLVPHTREEYRERMGHAWLGFAADQLEEWLRQGGFGNVRYLPLAPDPRARGPRLFAATGTRL
ncbi:MAG TPA: metalloregulator ArsR/SmtB family transcription factor [Longimicrobiales bacterium]